MSVWVLLATACGLAAAGVTERVSVSSAGDEGNALSGREGGPAISANGRFVAFESDATNLVPGDTSGLRDIFVHDRVTGITERVTVSSQGEQANGPSEGPSVSADGRFVAYHSVATNLVPDDTNAISDTFVRDRLAGTTERISVSTTGEEGNAGSGWPAISADGLFVAFESVASNLVPDDTNGVPDVFIHDREYGITERISVSSSGEQSNAFSRQAGGESISADGRFVVFASDATNLVPGGTNGQRHVYLRDWLNETTELISVSSTGEQGTGEAWHASVSLDGDIVAFQSPAGNLVPGDTNGGMDIFVRYVGLGITARVSVSTGGAQGNGYSGAPWISDDGRFVAFSSWATTLVPGDTNGAEDVFVRDLDRGTTERISVSSAGAQGNSTSAWPSISADGGYVTFRSEASNLVANDTNALPDVFVRRVFVSLLSSGYVIPISGDTSTAFTFRVKYWDTGDLPPTSMWVGIWSSAAGTIWRQMWEFDPSDTETANGKWYTYWSTLPAGDYAYRFAAAAGTEWVYWPQPPGSYKPGPSVAAGNPVVLSSGYVTPATGTDATNFTWRVKYWNTANAAPDDVWCAIWFPTLKTTYWYGMWPYDPADSNYRDGAWYTFQRRWLPSGAYAYRFAARQGGNWAYWPAPAGSYQSGPTVGP